MVSPSTVYTDTFEISLFDVLPINPECNNIFGLTLKCVNMD